MALLNNFTTTITTTVLLVAAHLTLLSQSSFLANWRLLAHENHDLRDYRREETRQSSWWWWDGIPGAKYINKLNGATSYYNFINSTRPTFIMFYKNWCVYSKKAREAFASAAKQFWKEKDDDDDDEHHPFVAFGAVDCAIEIEICKNAYIDGVPKFYYFQKGQFQRQFISPSADRTLENFVRWITELEEELLMLQEEHQQHEVENVEIQEQTGARAALVTTTPASSSSPKADG